MIVSFSESFGEVRGSVDETSMTGWVLRSRRLIEGLLALRTGLRVTTLELSEPEPRREAKELTESRCRDPLLPALNDEGGEEPSPESNESQSESFQEKVWVRLPWLAAKRCRMLRCSSWWIWTERRLMESRDRSLSSRRCCSAVFFL